MVRQALLLAVQQEMTYNRTLFYIYGWRMIYKRKVAFLSLLVSLVGCSTTKEQQPPEEIVNQSTLTVEEQVPKQEQEPEQEQEPNTSSIDSKVLLDNQPTRQVLTALESVTDTLNILSFGIFAGSKI